MKGKIILIFAMLGLLASTCKKDEPCIDESKINPQAACTADWRPVCGCNGTTYSNECVATNAGVLHWTDGECN